MTRRPHMPNMIAQTLAAMLACGIPTARAAGTFDLRAAIAAAHAGDTIRVPLGIHRGNIVIDKPLTLEGDDATNCIIDAGGSGDVLRVTAPDVTIRNLTLRGTGALLEQENAAILALAPRITIEHTVIADALFGVLLKNAPGSAIRNNVIGGKTSIDIARRGDGIRLWQCEGAVIDHNLVHDSRDVVVWYSSNVVLSNNTVAGCRYGMHFMFTDSNTLEGNTLEDNSVGAFLMYSKDLILRRNVFARNRGPSGYGLGLKDMGRIHAQGNLFLANRVGTYIDNSPHEMNVFADYADNVFACNDIGVAFLPNVKRNRFSGNTFMENLQQVAIIGSGAFADNEFSVNGRGNFWSDYRGYDADGDGIGDLPYRASSLFENLMEREPKMRLLLHSPAQQALELAARAFPIVKPAARFVDEHPLMQAGAVDVPLPAAPAAGAMWLAAGALLAAGAIGLWFARIGGCPCSCCGGVS